MLLRLSKHVAHARRTYTYKHLNKIRAGNRKKRYLRFTGNCLGKKCFTRAWRAYHQYTTWNFSTQFLKFSRITQKLYQFGYLFLSFFHSRYVVKCHVDLIFTH